MHGDLAYLANARTGEDRWRTLYLAQAARLLAGLDQTELGPVWNQDLYGKVQRYLGPVHGYSIAQRLQQV